MEATLVEGVGDEVVVVLSAAVAVFTMIVIQWTFCQQPASVSSGTRDSTEVAEVNGEAAAAPTVSNDPEHQNQEPSAGDPEAEIILKDSVEVQIRLKYLNDTERCVKCSLSTCVGEFKDRFFPEERTAGKAIRLISCGRLLNEDSFTLRYFGVAEGNNVLHVQISNPPLTPTSANSQQTGSNVSPTVSRLEANIASLAYLVLGAMLVLFWYVHFQYRDLFTNSATTALVGISGLFCVFVFAPSQPLPVYFHTVAQQIAPEI